MVLAIFLNAIHLLMAEKKSNTTLGDRSFYMAAPNETERSSLFLLKIYFQLMLSRRLLKLIYFRRRFPANLLFLFLLFFYKQGFVNRIFTE